MSDCFVFGRFSLKEIKIAEYILALMLKCYYVSNVPYFTKVFIWLINSLIIAQVVILFPN